MGWADSFPLLQLTVEMDPVSKVCVSNIPKTLDNNHITNKVFQESPGSLHSSVIFHSASLTSVGCAWRTGRSTAPPLEATSGVTVSRRFTRQMRSKAFLSVRSVKQVAHILAFLTELHLFLSGWKCRYCTISDLKLFQFQSPTSILQLSL